MGATTLRNRRCLRSTWSRTWRRTAARFCPGCFWEAEKVGPSSQKRYTRKLWWGFITTIQGGTGHSRDHLTTPANDASSCQSPASFESFTVIHWRIPGSQMGCSLQGKRNLENDKETHHTACDLIALDRIGIQWWNNWSIQISWAKMYKKIVWTPKKTPPKHSQLCNVQLAPGADEAHADHPRVELGSRGEPERRDSNVSQLVGTREICWFDFWRVGFEIGQIWNKYSKKNMVLKSRHVKTILCCRMDMNLNTNTKSSVQFGAERLVSKTFQGLVCLTQLKKMDFQPKAIV